ncbi:MAG: hypothetical protein ACR2O1_12020 [Boseongicola sp.]
MQRFVLAILVLAVAFALITVVLRGIAQFFADEQIDGQGGAQTTRGNMQKISFFLLLILMAYVAMSGMS